MRKLNLFGQFTGAILLFGWVVHSSICLFLYSLSQPTLGCPISTLNIARSETAGELLSLARQPANSASPAHCSSSPTFAGKTLSALEPGSWRSFSWVWGYGRWRWYSSIGWNGDGIAGVHHSLEELWLSKISSFWLDPWLLRQNTAVVMKELPQEGLSSPSSFCKSTNYRVPQCCRKPV